MRNQVAVSAFAAMALLVLSPGTNHAQSKCAGAKIKEAGKKAACLLGLEAKEAKKGEAKDPLKVQKCLDKFSKAFAKAEGKPPCATTGDMATIEGKVDTLVDDMDDALAPGSNDPPGISKCASAKLKAAGKSAKCLLVIESKEAAKGDPPDPVKVQKCKSKFSTAFAKADALTDCLAGAGDGGARGADVDAFVADVDGELNVPLPTTTTTTLPPCPGTLGLSGDDFDDDTLDICQWSAFGASCPAGNAPCSEETSQQLRVTIPGGASGSTFSAGYHSICQLQGDYDVQVDYQLLTWPTPFIPGNDGNGVRVDLTVGPDATNRISLGAVDQTQCPEATRPEVYLVNSSTMSPPCTSTTDLTGKLRQVRSGTTVTGYYFDGVDWVVIDSAPAASIGNATVSLDVHSHDSVFRNQTVTAAFDNFLVNSGTLVCPGPPPVCTGPFTLASDDMNDNFIDPCTWAAPVGGTGPSVAETNGRMEVTIPANSTDDPVDQIFGSGYFSICKLRGDYDLQIDYELLIWPPSNGVRVALATAEPPNLVERVSFGDISEDFGSSPRESYATHFDSDGVQGIVGTSDLAGKLRQVRTGTTVYGYRWDGSSWQLIHSASTTGDDVAVNPAAFSHDRVFTDQNVRVTIDNFVLNSGTVVCPNPPPVCTGPFTLTSDDMDDNIIDPCMWISADGGTGPLTQETNERMEVTIPGTSTDDPGSATFGGGYFSICRLGGDFDIQVDYELLTWPPSNGVRVTLATAEPPNLVERASLGNPLQDFNGQPRESYLTHFASDDVQGFVGTSDLSGTLREVRTGSTMYGYYWDAVGMSWVLIHSAPTTTADVIVHPGVFSHDRVFSDQQVKVAMDDFVINSASTVVCPNSSTTTTTTSTTLPPVGQCNEQVIGGFDTAATHVIELGASSGTFQFEYQTYTIEDRIIVSYEGNPLFDTGCVGAMGSESLSYSGSSTQVTVEVIPDCAGGTGTAWNFLVHCPE